LAKGEFLHRFYGALDSLISGWRCAMDIVYIALGVGFFVLSGWLISALEKL
jgi:hypothetical protein